MPTSWASRTISTPPPGRPSSARSLPARNSSTRASNKPIKWVSNNNTMVQTDEVKDWGEWSASLAVQGNWADSWKTSWTDSSQKTTERPRATPKVFDKPRQMNKGSEKKEAWKMTNKGMKDGWRAGSPSREKDFHQGKPHPILRDTKNLAQFKSKPPHMLQSTAKSYGPKVPPTKPTKTTDTPPSKSSASPSSRVSSVRQSRQPSRDGSEIKSSGTPPEQPVDDPIEPESSAVDPTVIAIPESPKAILRASAQPFVVKLPTPTPVQTEPEGPPSPTLTVIKCESYQDEVTQDDPQYDMPAAQEYPPTVDIVDGESPEPTDPMMLVTEIPQALLNDLPPTPRLTSLANIPIDTNVQARYHWVDKDILAAALNYSLAPEDLVDLLSPGYYWGSVYVSVEPTIISQGPDGKLFRKTLRGPALQAEKLSKLVKGLPTPTEFSAAFGNLVQLAIHHIYGMDVLKALVSAMTQFLEDFLGLSQLYTWESCLRLWLISAPDLLNGTPNIDRWYAGADQRLESRMLVRKDQLEPNVPGRLA